MRIERHPILNFDVKKKVFFTYNGRRVFGNEGDTIASALHALGVRKLSESIEKHRPRGFYCAIGNCASCNMIVNGKPNVRTCVTKLEDGMVVTEQHGKGVLYEKS